MFENCTGAGGVGPMGAARIFSGEDFSKKIEKIYKKIAKYSKKYSKNFNTLKNFQKLFKKSQNNFGRNLLKMDFKDIFQKI